MFGNKNAGPQGIWMHLVLRRPNGKPKKTRAHAAMPLSGKGFEMLDQRETFFAVGSPVRWKQ
jgi:hypothetical protein